MLKNNKISRWLSVFLILVMVLASIPVREVRAAEDDQDVFVITSFEKQDEWKLEKNTFAAGTKTEDMKFPTEWKVTGYHQEDPEKITEEKLLEKLTWEGTLIQQEQSAEKELYSEKALAGEYLFHLVLPQNMKTEDGVAVPSQKIVITEESTKPEEPKEEEPKPEEPKVEEPKPEEPKVEEPKPEEPKVEEPKVEEPKPEEPKVEEPQPEVPKTDPAPQEETIIWQLKARIEELTRGDQRILLGKRYRIAYEVTGKDVDPQNPPKVTYEVIEGKDVMQVDADGIAEPQSAGNFKIRVSCKTPENVVCDPVVLEGVVKAQDTDSTIHWFRIGKWEGKITENPNGSEIVVEVPYGTDVTKLIPDFEIGEYAAVDKEMLTEQDFTNPVLYTVTSEDGKNVTTYTVRVQAVCTHQWQPASCTKPETCQICGNTRGEAKGHSWKEATCTEPKTCTVCKVTEGSPLGHKWKEATCTEPETCTVCKAERGTPLGHSWGEWKLVKKPTTKEGGLEERICSRCQGKETREIPRLNIIGKAENNYVTGIKEKGVYGLDEVITIQAYGDGMKNEKPIANDVRYLPTGWQISSYTGWDKEPYQASFRIKTAGNYQLQVHFQKQVFDGEKWVNQKETDVKKVNFSISANKVVPVKTGDESPIFMLSVMILLSATAMAAGMGWRLRRKSR